MSCLEVRRRVDLYLKLFKLVKSVADHAKTMQIFVYHSGRYRISKRGIPYYDKIACEKFKPRPLFFQPRPFKAHFLAQNEWLCWSIDLFTIENDAKVSHSKSLSTRTLASCSTKSISLSTRASKRGVPWNSRKPATVQ